MEPIVVVLLAEPRRVDHAEREAAVRIRDVRCLLRVVRSKPPHLDRSVVARREQVAVRDLERIYGRSVASHDRLAVEPDAPLPAQFLAADVALDIVRRRHEEPTALSRHRHRHYARRIFNDLRLVERRRIPGVDRRLLGVFCLDPPRGMQAVEQVHLLLLALLPDGDRIARVRRDNGVAGLVGRHGTHDALSREILVVVPCILLLLALRLEQDALGGDRQRAAVDDRAREPCLADVLRTLVVEPLLENVEKSDVAVELGSPFLKRVERSLCGESVQHVELHLGRELLLAHDGEEQLAFVEALLVEFAQLNLALPAMRL
mmetsp:Transcript_22111/g.69163  ORF Transcript_22111/g.69163 Transcript_22111/m.69163 type:complete len:318 (+) Transcript_22111:1640-2593(+)